MSGWQTVKQDKKDVAILINIYENILNIHKTTFAFTYITFTTQKLKKQNKIISQLVSYLFLELFPHLINSFSFCKVLQEILVEWMNSFLAGHLLQEVLLDWRHSFPLGHLLQEILVKRTNPFPIGHLLQEFLLKQRSSFPLGHLLQEIPVDQLVVQLVFQLVTQLVVEIVHCHPR